MTGVGDLIDAASVAHWLEHDEHEIHASFDVKVARWKIGAVYEPTPIVRDPCDVCHRDGYAKCRSHAEVDADVIDPPHLQHLDWHESYADELLAAPAFAWRFSTSLNAVYTWCHLSEREKKAVDMWLIGERQEDIAKAIHTRKEAVRPIVMEAFAAIRQRVRASIQQQQQLQEAS